MSKALNGIGVLFRCLRSACRCNPLICMATLSICRSYVRWRAIRHTKNVVSASTTDKLACKPWRNPSMKVRMLPSIASGEAFCHCTFILCIEDSFKALARLRGNASCILDTSTTGSGSRVDNVVGIRLYTKQEL